jgi:hypothetical protein
VWTAEVKDVSSGGIGLLLKRRFEPGTILAVEPQGPTADTPCVLLVRVVHATRQADGVWLLGGRLITDLTEDEVQALR